MIAKVRRFETSMGSRSRHVLRDIHWNLAQYLPRPAPESRIDHRREDRPEGVAEPDAQVIPVVGRERAPLEQDLLGRRVALRDRQLVVDALDVAANLQL